MDSFNTFFVISHVIFAILLGLTLQGCEDEKSDMDLLCEGNGKYTKECENYTGSDDPNWWEETNDIISRPAPEDQAAEQYYMYIRTNWKPHTYGASNVHLLPQSWGYATAADFRNAGKYSTWQQDAAARWGELVICATKRQQSGQDFWLHNQPALASIIRTFASNGLADPLMTKLQKTDGVKADSCTKMPEAVESPSQGESQVQVDVYETHPCIQFFVKFKVGSSPVNGETTHDWFVYDRYCLTQEDGQTFEQDYSDLVAYAYSAGTDGATTYSDSATPTSGSIRLLSETGTLVGLKEMLQYHLGKR